MNILFFDLETAPLLAHVWHPHADWVPHGQMVHDSFLLCWAAKFQGGAIQSDVLTGKEARKQDDKRLVAQIGSLVREADIVVAHNINRFDIPQLNGRLMLHGLEPLGPVRTIDTLTLAKKSFRLAYNKLDYLGKVLGVGEKIKTDFDLWLDAYHGDEDALADMLEYNIYDVVLLEKIFNKMKPYVFGLPRLVDAVSKDERVCPFCGSSELMRRGFYRTNGTNKVKLQCQDCRRYSRVRETDMDTRLAVHPL